MTRPGSDRGQFNSALEQLLFRREDQGLAQKFKAMAARGSDTESLSSLTGITDPRVLQKLAALHLRPALAASIPVLPLAEIAWADGQLDPGERKAIHDAAAQCGIPEGSLPHALLESWLEKRPPPEMSDAWTLFIKELCETLDEEDRQLIEDAVLARALSVAEASGGFLGVSRKVSRKESAVLARIRAAFA